MACCSRMVLSESGVSTFTDIPSATMTKEYYVPHVQTCENPVTIYYNWLAAISFAAHLIHKLPLLFDLTSYVLLFSPFYGSSVHFRVCCGPSLPIQFFSISSSLWPLMPIFYFQYLHSLLYPFALSHLCPSHNHKHQSS